MLKSVGSVVLIRKAVKLSDPGYCSVSLNAVDTEKTLTFTRITTLLFLEAIIEP